MRSLNETVSSVGVGGGAVVLESSLQAETRSARNASEREYLFHGE
jgi:hypothetical protein